MRESDQRYFDRIDARLDEAFEVASRARRQGRDPVADVEIPVAEDMADRVENILGITGVAERVRELEAELGREAAALELAKDFAEGRVGDYDSREGKIEGAVRTAVALLTEGVVAAPIEGIDRVEIRPNDDGTEFVRLFYAGPIRSAGGTAQALSVLVADYTRTLLGIDRYKPREEEVERYAAEVSLYDNETGLQYSPKEDETKYIAEHCPIMLDGEATSDGEVSGYRNLERVDTNRARGGMCLVLAEGIALKAPKIERYTGQLDEVEWPWIADLIGGGFADGEDDQEPESATAVETVTDDSPPRPDPSKKYLRDLIAGRPVFGHPSEPGGFRLRYGRARNHGFATGGVHPATMRLVDDFLATGTQLKTERPGKAAGVVPVDSIEGPTVKLATGEVRRFDDPDEAEEIRNGVVEILDLGEYLVNMGEFVENNHALAPASYTVEWWVQELAASGADVQALDDSAHVDLESPTASQAIDWATSQNAPLHPAYTYCWHDLTVEEFGALADAVEDARFAETDGAAVAGETTADRTLVLPNEEPVRTALESLLVEHRQGEETVTVPDALPLLRSLGFTESLDREWSSLSAEAREWADGDNAIKAVNEVAPFTVRERAPTRIGSRMGRPEKSEKREMNPAVHALFPIGEAGGDQRDITAAADSSDGPGPTGTVEVSIGRRTCPSCETETYRATCPECGDHTEKDVRCPDCDIAVTADESGHLTCPRCGGEATSAHRRSIDLKGALREALDAVDERDNAYEILKGVKGLTSAAKTPEPIEKGILRAKHGVSTFKDGTVRYDMTDLPVTAVRPVEIGVSVEQLRDLGYETDLDGEPLRYEDQLVPLRVQDVVLSDRAGDHLVDVADFVDELLEDFYGLDPFYDVDDRDDLIGELVFGLAPHTSAAVVGRIAGFTGASVGYAHPYFHAAKRRNCFHPATKVWYRDEAGEWHYERIKRLVEDRLEDPREDDFGTLIQELDGEVYVPSIDKEGTLTRKRVEAVSKHPSPNFIKRIRTESGRELKVTFDHEVHVFDGERIISKAATEVEKGDYLVRPRHLNEITVSEENHTFDLLAEFIHAESIDNKSLMIKGLDKDELYELFESALEDDWDSDFYPLKSTASYLGLTKKGLSNYLYRESLPVDVLLDLFDSVDELVQYVPDDVSLGMKRDSTSIDRYVEINDRVATLLGYYAAEGFAREQETPKGTIHQTTISGSESEAREFFIQVLQEEFGVNAYRENKYKITTSGRLLRVFFDTILEAGIFAHTKSVPQCIFDSPDHIVGAFLSGYFSGDGTVNSTGSSVRATTVSKELKEDVIALLTRLEIDAAVRHVDPVFLRDKFPDFYDKGDLSKSKTSYIISLTSDQSARFAERAGFHLQRKNRLLRSNVHLGNSDHTSTISDGGSRDYLIDPVEDAVIVGNNHDSVYCLTVAETHSLIINDLSGKQCDGDEDCVMLLMDGLLNFSKDYLPSNRGGRMDAPLVMSSRIDPSEIDDEAHNMDIVDRYPLEFYEASRRMAEPSEVDIELAEATVGTDREYAGFDHTHDTSDIALGPSLSAYKTLGSMEEKLDAQLELARKLRAVDESDVAERIIEYHFLPDLLGNLRAFSRQETRCLDCGTKYRRPPLTGSCRECGGNVNLTVHEGSVSKYLETAIRIADEYGAREYTKQRLEVIDRSLESIFVNDKNRQSGIADFM